MEDINNEQPVTEEGTSTTAKVLIGLGISLSAIAGLPALDYYIDRDEQISGREIQDTLTSNELDETVSILKERLTTQSRELTINEYFAIEDLINYKCPDGFNFKDLGPTLGVEQINQLLDGDCGK